MAAIRTPSKFPLFRNLISDILNRLSGFEEWTFGCVPPTANKDASKISRSVTKDYRYQSYIARNDPQWLHALIASEAR